MGMKLCVTAIIGCFDVDGFDASSRGRRSGELATPSDSDALCGSTLTACWCRACHDPSFRRHHPFFLVVLMTQGGQARRVK
jgi:hypothetical protein